MTGWRKYCKKCKHEIDDIAQKTTRVKQKARLEMRKKELDPPVVKEPKPVWPQTEKETFEVVWIKRKHICEVCMKPIPYAMAVCFAHVLGKGMDSKFRLNPYNIILVCWEKCHREVDHLASGSKHILRGILASGKRLSVCLLRFYNGL